jgi:hypothetical protein
LQTYFDDETTRSTKHCNVHGLRKVSCVITCYSLAAGLLTGKHRTLDEASSSKRLVIAGECEWCSKPGGFMTPVPLGSVIGRHRVVHTRR